MEHADPWDEVARLERQMEIELLSQLERTVNRETERLPDAERKATDRTLLDRRQ